MNNDDSKKLTFGISLGPVPPWERVLGWARLVESLGFDKLWLPDHFANPRDKEMPWYDCWTLLSALAVKTEKITVGMLVASMTLRNPAILAKMAVTLDHISGGRLELGIGAAGAKNCHIMTGVPEWGLRERSERYQEFVEIIDQMLKEEVTIYHGEFYNLEETILRPRPITDPRPVLNVAAHGLKALRLAARYGDAWNSFTSGKDLTPKQTSDIIRQRTEIFCDEAIKAGRDPSRLGRTFLFGWTSDRLFRTMDAFYDTIGRYAEAGIRDFVFVYVPGDDNWKEQGITTEDLLQKIALEAIPAIKK